MADGCLDLVLLYDVFHGLTEPDRVLAEIYRILKPEGVLSFSDHHMKNEAIVSGVSATGLFRRWLQGDLTCEFRKRAPAGDGRTLSA